MKTSIYNMNKKRCTWATTSDPAYTAYHDHEWGVPVHDDRLLFEMLTLEGAQAGLSWLIILKKRANYRKAFDNFNVKKIASYSEGKTDELLNNLGIVRNRLKILSTVRNAGVFLEIQKGFGSFDRYLWSYTGGKPIINSPNTHSDVPTKTELSDKISLDLKKRGMSFVGSTIIYAYLQAVGVVNDHESECHKK